ncbi:MAG TPA: cytochrome C oxidase Cbb3, partial [Gammaproteobacteria bacterium]|nr:cytochrome C oxidase Cbb3 [Gammaproteobacteria bacterium]
MRYLTLFALLMGLNNLLFAEQPAAEPLYQEHCSACHGNNRLGVTGPALLPENLRRLRKKKAFATIAEGRPATQMLPFAGKLNDQQTQALVDYIFTPLAETPMWGEKEIL